MTSMVGKAGIRALIEAGIEAGGKAQTRPCVIRGHCRTHVFELPKVELKADALLQPIVIVERQGAKATVVSDLPGYFREISPFRHYGLCTTLRSKIDEAVSNSRQGSATDRLPLFVVVQQETECETTLDEGTCYTVNHETVTDAHAEEEVIVALHVDDAPWPETVEDGPGFVTTVLAAVKIVQDETAAIREVAEASCFYDEEGFAVYPVTISMAPFGLSLISPKSQTELAERAAQMRSLIETFETKLRDGDTNICDLVEALRLERIDTDHYRRAWYLSLFEAIEAVLSKGHKHAFHQEHRSYRKSIGHPRPSTRMDMNQFVRLQRDSLAELRRMFLGH